jgi:hypothetical protein
MPKVNPRNKVGGKRHQTRTVGGGGMEGRGGGVSSLLPRCMLGLALYALATLIRRAYTWASRHPSRLTALAVALAAALLASCSAQRDGIVILSGLFPPLLHGHTTLFKPPMDYLELYYSAASAAPCVLLLPVSHIAESAGNKIEVIIVPLALRRLLPLQG